VGSDSGSAFVFERSDIAWSLTAKLVGVSDAGAQFGRSVAISGDGLTIVAGASRSDHLATDSGAAYIFRPSGIVWVRMATLVATDTVAGDLLGQSVSISNDGLTIGIGAPTQPEGSFKPGAAYIFWQSGAGWIQTAKLTAPSTQGLGHSVAISGDGRGLIARAVYGSASVFQQSGGLWRQAATFASSADGGDYDKTVAISGDGRTIVIGEPTNDELATDAGAVHVYTLPAP
jgi:hypothetical protein